MYVWQVAPIKDDEALTGSFDNDSEDETGTSLRLRGKYLYNFCRRRSF